MIKIINGTVGIKMNDGRRAVMTEADGAFSLSEAEEKRLVKLGAAAYYTAGIMGPGAPVYVGNDASEEENPEENLETGNGQDTPEEKPWDDLDQMTFQELRDMAKSLSLSAAGTREELVAKIREHSGVSMAAAMPQ